MVNIFFVPGMFGSSMEFCLKNFSTQLCTGPVDLSTAITPDGSMHTFSKEAHPVTLEELKLSISKNAEITTPIYPMRDAKFSDIFDTVAHYGSGKNIIICASSIMDAELNLLFVFYKVAKGVINQGLDIFTNTKVVDLSKWNDEYTHWSQMKPWELREWFSIFYRSWIIEWVTPLESNTTDALVLYNTEILEDFEHTVVKLLKYCNLSPCNQDSLTELSVIWRKSQEYILNEFKCIGSFVSNTINNIDYVWDLTYPMNIITESIIQSRLREHGYELKCYNLNNLPQNSKDLYPLLEKI